MTARALSVIAVALLLGACADSGRFGDFGGPGRQAVAPSRPPPLAPAPTAPVISSPLPPPAPVQAQPLPPPGGAGPNPAVAGLPPAGSSLPIEPDEAPPPRPPVAAPQAPLDPPPQPPRPAPPRVTAAPAPPPAGPTRTGATGTWNARESSGNSCRVTLSSQPTLDLYRASSAGCQSRDLQRVSAWELRGEEIYLYERGGAVAARLRAQGGGFAGAGSQTGAPITLSK
jgi:hypothetical protein